MPTPTPPTGLPDGVEYDERVLRRVADTVAARLAGVSSPETVERYVRESYTRLAETARIRRYLPNLTEHFAVERLTALAPGQPLDQARAIRDAIDTRVRALITAPAR